MTECKKAVFYFENSLFVLLVYFSEFHFARTNSITAGNKDTNIIATIRSFKFF